jgi:hypothetical protein
MPARYCLEHINQYLKSGRFSCKSIRYQDIAFLGEDGKPDMLDKKLIIDNALVKEIISIRIDTLWKMIGQFFPKPPDRF